MSRRGGLRPATLPAVSIISRIVVICAAEHVGLADLALVEREQHAVGDVLDVDHVHSQARRRAIIGIRPARKWLICLPIAEWSSGP